MPQTDPVTLALTGMLPFSLLLAAFLTWPVAHLLLRLYTRAVRRSMRSSARAGRPVASALPEPGPHTAPVPPAASAPATLYELPQPSSGEAERLFDTLLARPRRAAIVYAVAGAAYALTMAFAQLLADSSAIGTLRLLFLFWVFGWPVVLTISIVALSTRRAKAAVTLAYFAGMLAIGAVGVARSPDLTWFQVVQAWILFDLPATALLLTYLARRIRAVGPLVLTFMLLALLGSNVIITLAGSRDSVLSVVVRAAGTVGLGGTGAFFALLLIGFLLFAVLGWAVLGWIGRRYRAKAISDESVTVDAIWALFTIVNAVNLVFGGALWALAALAAFAVYAACVRVGLALLARMDPISARGPALLVLRSFSIGRDSERLFDVIGRHWRRTGSIQMIAGVDLLSRTVEPHEFLGFVSGRLGREFIDGDAALERRMLTRDAAPDRDLRFRVNEFFCYDDTWRMVLSRLVHDSDAVLMDLRGFTRENTGCVFELRELARLVPLARVVFVADRRTDEGLLAETLGGSRAGVLRLASLDASQLKKLLRALANAAAPPAPTGAPAA